MPPDFTLDLGFIGSSHRDGKPRFRSTAPPPDGAERVGSQRRVSDGARRPRLRAAPRSLPTGEILLIPPLHGSALRSVVNAAPSRVYERRMCLGGKKVSSIFQTWDALWDELEFTVEGNCSDFVGI